MEDRVVRLQAIAKAILEYAGSQLARSTVQFLYYPKKNKIPVGAGSGVLIRDRNNFFIYTAAHVISEGMISNLFINLHGRESLSLSMPYLVTSLPDGKNRKDDQYDVGALLLRDEDVQKLLTLNCIFIGQDTLLTGYEAHKDDHVICLGYPSTKLKLNIAENTMTQQYFIFPTNPVISLKEKANRLSSKDHILIPYNRRKLTPLFSNQKIMGPDPHGMSGGGVWLIRIGEKKMDAYLIGIMIEIDQRSYMVGTKIKFFVDSVKTYLSELMELRQQQIQEKV